MNVENYNTQMLVWDEHYSTDLAVFFTLNDALLIVAFFVLKSMLNSFGNKMAQERRNLIIFYGVFVLFTTL